MSFATVCLIAAMTTADAIVTILNTASAVGPRHFAEARELVEEEARAGKPLQQFVVGVTTDDKELAKRYLDASREKIRYLAVEKDNPLAWYLLSMENNDVKCLRRAALGGNVQALNAMGALAIQGAVEQSKSPTNSVEKLLKEGFGYFGQAAAMRDANGFINLGTCYQRGYGCSRDMQLAFECFKSAAELGHPEGMDYMSACYQFGHGVSTDEEKSLYWKMRGRCARGAAAAEKWLRERK